MFDYYNSFSTAEQKRNGGINHQIEQKFVEKVGRRLDWNTRYNSNLGLQPSCFLPKKIANFIKSVDKLERVCYNKNVRLR